MAINQLDKYLKKWTGQTTHYWMDYIGTKAGKYAGKKGTCAPARIFKELAKDLEDVIFPKLGEQYDGNLAVAKMLSLITTFWFFRVGHGKTHDPRRPLSQRKVAAKKLVEYQQLLLLCLVDGTQDELYFPSQPWAFPFGPQPCEPEAKWRKKK